MQERMLGGWGRKQEEYGKTRENGTRRNAEGRRPGVGHLRNVCGVPTEADLRCVREDGHIEAQGPHVEEQLAPPPLPPQLQRDRISVSFSRPPLLPARLVSIPPRLPAEL